MLSQNKIQHTDSPWVYYFLNKLQLEELFDVNSQMQEAINKELYNYLANILNLLSEEKLSSTNAIDSLIVSTGTNITNMKECPNCHQKKKVAKIITNKTNNTFVFKLYSFNDELSVTHILRISITQQRTTDQRVNT